MQKEDLSIKYTIIKLERQDHINKLISYLHEQHQVKRSFCRFFLRGICIMKNQCCLFAHDFDQLKINHKEIQDWNIVTKQNYNDKQLKQARRRHFTEKTDFYQKPLFIIKQLDYNWLYTYQFSERYKKSHLPIVTLQEINKKQDLRNRIREIMHREQWDKLIDFIQRTYPDVDYTIDMFSFWFAYLGFEKAQTLSKFKDFTRYLTHVKGYHEFYIVVPPRTQRTLFFVKHKTYLHQKLEQLKKDHQIYRQETKKIKEQRLKKIPQNMQKRFICRFYMAGNCRKSQEECMYVHNMKKHIYDKDIFFEKQYRQPPKSYEDRRIYVSLFNFYKENKSQSDRQITLQDINSNFQIKNTIRKQVHLKVYQDFIAKLQHIHQTTIFKLSLIRQQYQRFGFNHTDQNKFGQLESYFQTLGYHKEQIQNLQTRQKQSFVYKIPTLLEMQHIYENKIYKILKQQINTQTQDQEKQILQSSIRRLIYSNTKKNDFEVPLHVFLKKKKITLSKLLQSSFPQYIKYIFFQTNQQNFKKLLDLLRKFFKKHKNFVYEINEIQSHIRDINKDQININSINNWKNLLQLALLQLDKQIYSWPIANSTLIIDRSHQHQHNANKLTYQSKPILNVAFNQLYNAIKDKIIDDQILIVDDLSSFNYCRLVLQSCFIYGVDLQGSLNENGYIDLIQISCINIKKYIFIIDIFKIKKTQNILFDQTVSFLKDIFEDNLRLKIFHACQNDSLALASILGIYVRNVFDTSGMQNYFNQRAIYRQMHEKNLTYEHTLKKIKASIYMVGLNRILQKWKAPRGPNQYKELMKKHFGESPRSYFEHRPLHKQFLNYSARDVEDLIQVYIQMTKSQEQLIWPKIGELYSKSRL